MLLQANHSEVLMNQLDIIIQTELKKIWTPDAARHINSRNGVASDFPGESQNEEDNEQSLRKNKKN